MYVTMFEACEDGAVEYLKLIGGAAGLADCAIHHTELSFRLFVAYNIGDPASIFGVSVRVEYTGGK